MKLKQNLMQGILSYQDLVKMGKLKEQPKEKSETLQYGDIDFQNGKLSSNHIDKDYLSLCGRVKTEESKQEKEGKRKDEVLRRSSRMEGGNCYTCIYCPWSPHPPWCAV